MQKSSKIDFFTVEITDSKDLETVLRNVHGIPADSEKRNVEINDDWVRLVRGKVNDAGYLGDMMRISMAPAGFRANLQGEITAVNLDKNEGMAECSAFYYDFESEILVLQRNAKAVSAKQMASFIKQQGSIDGDVEIKPILRPTDLMKMKILPVIRKIHISAEVIDVMPTLENLDENTMRVIQNAAQTESPGIEIVMKSAREKGATLNQAVAAATLESWLRIHDDFSDDDNEIVKKIVVSGKDESGTTVEFDMLKDRIFAVMNYQLEPDDRAMWVTRRDHIQKTWDLHKGELKRILGAQLEGEEAESSEDGVDEAE